METRFVKPFSAPQLVVRRQTGAHLGVYDGARVFENGYYATLKNGEVQLFDNYGQQLYKDSVLEDVWIAPNGYRLIKRKDAELWELFRSNGKCCGVGERAAVFCHERLSLIFLKQKDVSVWRFYNVEKSSVQALERMVNADDVDVRFENQLLFILTLGGKHIMQYINLLYMKPEHEIGNVPYYELLPDGSVVVSKYPIQRYDGRFCVQIMPHVCADMQIYSPDLKSHFGVDGLVMFSSGLSLRKHGAEWRAFIGRRLIKRDIYDLQLRLVPDSSVVWIEGINAEGKRVRMVADAPGKVLMEYGRERYFIFDNFVVACAEGTGDVFPV